MKFAKELEAKALSKWRSQYIRYKALKKILKAVEVARAAAAAAGPDGATSPSPRMSQDASGNATPTKNRTSRASAADRILDETIAATSRAFVNELQGELDRINGFVHGAQTAILAQRRRMEEVRSGQLPPSELGIAASNEVELKRGLLAHERRLWHLVTELRDFVELNYIGFYKAAKKHDKVTRLRTLDRIMKAVDRQPFMQVLEPLGALGTNAVTGSVDVLSVAGGASAGLAGHGVRIGGGSRSSMPRGAAGIAIGGGGSVDVDSDGGGGGSGTPHAAAGTGTDGDASDGGGGGYTPTPLSAGTPVAFSRDAATASAAGGGGRRGMIDRLDGEGGDSDGGVSDGGGSRTSGTVGTPLLQSLKPHAIEAAAARLAHNLHNSRDVIRLAEAVGYEQSHRSQQGQQQQRQAAHLTPHRQQQQQQSSSAGSGVGGAAVTVGGVPLVRISSPELVAASGDDYAQQLEMPEHELGDGPANSNESDPSATSALPPLDLGTSASQSSLRAHLQLAYQHQQQHQQNARGDGASQLQQRGRGRAYSHQTEDRLLPSSTTEAVAIEIAHELEQIDNDNDNDDDEEEDEDSDGGDDEGGNRAGGGRRRSAGTGSSADGQRLSGMAVLDPNADAPAAAAAGSDSEDGQTRRASRPGRSTAEADAADEAAGITGDDVDYALGDQEAEGYTPHLFQRQVDPRSPSATEDQRRLMYLQRLARQDSDANMTGGGDAEDGDEVGDDDDDGAAADAGEGGGRTGQSIGGNNDNAADGADDDDNDDFDDEDGGLVRIDGSNFEEGGQLRHTRQSAATDAGAATVAAVAEGAAASAPSAAPLFATMASSAAAAQTPDAGATVHLQDGSGAASGEQQQLPQQQQSKLRSSATATATITAGSHDASSFPIGLSLSETALPTAGDADARARQPQIAQQQRQNTQQQAAGAPSASIGRYDSGRFRDDNDDDVAGNNDDGYYEGQSPVGLPIDFRDSPPPQQHQLAQSISKQHQVQGAPPPSRPSPSLGRLLGAARGPVRSTDVALAAGSNVDTVTATSLAAMLKHQLRTPVSNSSAAAAIGSSSGSAGSRSAGALATSPLQPKSQTAPSSSSPLAAAQPASSSSPSSTSSASSSTIAPSLHISLSHAGVGGRSAHPSSTLEPIPEQAPFVAAGATAASAAAVGAPTSGATVDDDSPSSSSSSVAAAASLPAKVPAPSSSLPPPPGSPAGRSTSSVSAGGSAAAAGGFDFSAGAVFDSPSPAYPVGNGYTGIADAVDGGIDVSVAVDGGSATVPLQRKPNDAGTGAAADAAAAAADDADNDVAALAALAPGLYATLLTGAAAGAGHVGAGSGSSGAGLDKSSSSSSSHVKGSRSLRSDTFARHDGTAASNSASAGTSALTTARPGADGHTAATAAAATLNAVQASASATTLPSSSSSTSIPLIAKQRVAPLAAASSTSALAHAQQQQQPDQPQQPLQPSSSSSSGVGGINWSGRDHPTIELMLQQCDTCLMESYSFTDAALKVVSPELALSDSERLKRLAHLTSALLTSQRRIRRKGGDVRVNIRQLHDAILACKLELYR